MEKILLYLLYKFDYSWDKVYCAIKNNKRFPMSCVSQFADTLDDEYVTIIGKNYPTYLKNVYKPPFALFYKGEFGMLEKEFIGVIGNPSVANIEYLKKLSQKGYVLSFKEIFLTKDGLDLLQKNNIKSIICCNDVNKTKDDAKENQLFNNQNFLFLSEGYKHTNKSKDLDYSINRIFIGDDNPLIVIDKSINKDSGLIAYLSATKHKTYTINEKFINKTFDYIDTELLKIDAQNIQNSKSKGLERN